jgi:hypothetical protein
MASDLEIKVNHTYHRADGSIVHIGHSENFAGTRMVVFKETATSAESWSSGGNNFPGGIDPKKTLTGWVHPVIAAKLKLLESPAPAPGAAMSREQMKVEAKRLIDLLAAQPT